MKLLSRLSPKQELAHELAIELDDLVNKIDAFLEDRIEAEFDELREDLFRVQAINDALMEENIQQAASIQLLNHQVEVLHQALGYPPVDEGPELKIEVLPNEHGLTLSSWLHSQIDRSKD